MSMRATQFNEGWTWRRVGEPAEAARAVTLPHDAMLYEPRTEQAAGGINTGWYEGGDYLYEKCFTVPAEDIHKKLVLEFEGVYHNAEVWLNGEKLACRPYGYTNFYVELTGRVRAEKKNKLIVIAHNSDQPNSRWYSGAGIYRPVMLWTAEAQRHILLNGVVIRTLSVDTPEIEVSVKTSGSGHVSMQILDNGRLLGKADAPTEGEAVFRLALPEAKLWSPDAPQLYTCYVQFAEDEERIPFGIRSLTWGKDGLCLNGGRVIVQGACIHHDNGLLGACCYPDAEERKIRILKENGYNAIRSAHNPCSKALLDACDRLGMLVMDEYIDHWYIHKTEYDYVNYFMDWWQQDLKDMVEKDRNHPSVILYSTGNEVSETAQPRGIQLTRDMTEYLHALDDTRPVTCGVNIFFNFLSSIGFGVYSDEKAKKEAQKAEQSKAQGRKAKKKKAVGSQFFNDLAGLLGDDFMKLGATLHGCDVKTRDAFANMDIAGYNYGIRRYRHDLKKYPDRLILGSETFCSDAYQFRELAKEQPRLVGDFVWAGMDYLGEVGVGAWEYSDYAPDFSHGVGWVTAGSGRIDLTGKPLCEALYTRVALEQAAGPFIGVCPVDHTWDKHSPSAWKMSNAIESWSWNGCDGKTANVEVYARAAVVELFINGRSVGKKAVKKDCIVRFRCVYEPGQIEAVAYDGAGKEQGRAKLQTASDMTVLRAEPEQPTVQPGRLSYIRLHYTDSAGITKPLCRGTITVTVTGGRLLGLGSACPYHKRSYLDDTVDTYYGEALAIVQAEEAGELVLCASDGSNQARAIVTIQEG